MHFQVAADLMIEMDGRDQKKRLANQPAFFDTTFKRIRDFVTCALWVYHPGRKLKNLLQHANFSQIV